MRNLLFAAAAALVASGCMNTEQVNTKPLPPSGSEVSTVSSNIADLMKDPDSAKFRNWSGYSLSNGDRVICGQVNAKNSYGAYTGYEVFYVRLNGNIIKSRIVGGSATSGCANAASGSYKIQPN